MAAPARRLLSRAVSRVGWDGKGEGGLLAMSRRPPPPESEATRSDLALIFSASFASRLKAAATMEPKRLKRAHLAFNSERAEKQKRGEREKGSTQMRWLGNRYPHPPTVIGARMSHWKWRESKHEPSRASSGHQIRCCLFSLHFLYDILASITVLGTYYIGHILYWARMCTP